MQSNVELYLIVEEDVKDGDEDERLASFTGQDDGHIESQDNSNDEREDVSQ